jgi:hypothetical protein
LSRAPALYYSSSFCPPLQLLPAFLLIHNAIKWELSGNKLRLPREPSFPGAWSGWPRHPIMCGTVVIQL